MEVIDEKEIRHIAKLAELEFDQTQIEKFTSQIDRILGHVATISKADTKKVKPTSHALNITNVLRDDDPRESMSQDEVLSNAPEIKNDGFGVPKID